MLSCVVARARGRFNARVARFPGSAGNGYLFEVNPGPRFPDVMEKSSGMRQVRPCNLAPGIRRALHS